LAPLHSADYRWLLSSNLLWWLARFMEVVAMGWLVLDLTDSAWMVAVVGFFRSLPLILFGTFGESITDRFGRAARSSSSPRAQTSPSTPR